MLTKDFVNLLSSLMNVKTSGNYTQKYCITIIMDVVKTFKQIGSLLEIVYCLSYKATILNSIHNIHNNEIFVRKSNSNNGFFPISRTSIQIRSLKSVEKHINYSYLMWHWQLDNWIKVKCVPLILPLEVNQLYPNTSSKFNDNMVRKKNANDLLRSVLLFVKNIPRILFVPVKDYYQI